MARARQPQQHEEAREQRKVSVGARALDVASEGRQERTEPLQLLPRHRLRESVSVGVKCECERERGCERECEYEHEHEREYQSDTSVSERRSRSAQGSKTDIAGSIYMRNARVHIYV